MKKIYCLFFLLVLFSSCINDKNKDTKEQSKDWSLFNAAWKLPVEKDSIAFYYKHIVKYNEFPVRFKRGTTQIQIADLERKLRAKFGSDFKVKTCQCDSLLRNYSGLNIIEILKHGEELAVKPNGNGAGDSEPIIMDNVLYMSPNYKTQTDRLSNLVDSTYISIDEFADTTQLVGYKPSFKKLFENYPNYSPSTNAFKIGVFDTGFDFIQFPNGNIRNYIAGAEPVVVLKKGEKPPLSTTLNSQCSQNNFYGQNPPQDDDITRHGTLVTALLLHQLKGTPAKVYPVKVLDKDGKGNLFDFVCALASPDQMTAYNISLGFYADTASFPKKLVSAYMNLKKGWFFAAAGNKIEALDKESNDQSRDLLHRKYKFYPACLTDVPKMIVVTTVQRQKGDGKYKYAVCSKQNYSSQFAHVGVVPSGQGCLLGFNGVGGTGTSFAAPIMLGRTLATWHQGRPNQQFPHSPNSRGGFFGRPYPIFTRSEPTLIPRQIENDRLIEEIITYTMVQQSRPIRFANPRH